MEDLKKIRIEMESMKKRLAVYESNSSSSSSFGFSLLGVATAR